EGIHRTTYGEMVPRINRLAGVLKRIGVKPGDRVATLAWNNNRHLELYYAVPCMGAVLHTLNLRLFPQHLEFIINDAEDKVLFVDQSLLPLLKPLVGKIPSIKTVVLMGDGAPAQMAKSDNGLADLLDRTRQLHEGERQAPAEGPDRGLWRLGRAASADGGDGQPGPAHPPRLGHDGDLASRQRGTRGGGNQARSRDAPAPDARSR